MRSKGWDIPKIRNKTTGELEAGNIIYVLGTVDGKFYRKSTGKEANKLNIAWIKKNARDVLLKLIDKQGIEKGSRSIRQYAVCIPPSLNTWFSYRFQHTTFERDGRYT